MLQYSPEKDGSVTVGLNVDALRPTKYIIEHWNVYELNARDGVLATRRRAKMRHQARLVSPPLRFPSLLDYQAG